MSMDPKVGDFPRPTCVEGKKIAAINNLHAGGAHVIDARGHVYRLHRHPTTTSSRLRCARRWGADQ
jgi:hypothetical protein